MWMGLLTSMSRVPHTEHAHVANLYLPSSMCQSLSLKQASLEEKVVWLFKVMIELN